MHLKTFDPATAPTVSAWATTAAEVEAWCSRTEAPVPPAAIAAWSEPADVLSDAAHVDGELVGYRELWLDDDEDEVELAR